MKYLSVELDRVRNGAGGTGGIKAAISIDRCSLKEIYQDYGLTELPEDLHEEVFEYLKKIFEGHLRSAVYNAIEEYVTEYGDTPVESVAESLIDAGELEKPVRFYVGGIMHTAMLGKRDEAGKVPLLLDGSPHWRNETVPYPWETIRAVFHHETEKAIAGFYRDAKKL